MELRMSSAPRRRPGRDDRIILHFDYDCFYASVFENEQPALKGVPLGVKQKSILATCNYAARANGVKKLMLVSEARKICPDLVLMDGEDLTRFRHASKRLWSFLRSHSWNNRVERLGLDEVFLDVTDVVAYNQALLNPHTLSRSFFQLSPRDPEKGFSFDASAPFGCTYPADYAGACLGAPPASQPYTRLLLASHLAGSLRRGLEEDFGYTSTCGISTNKVLAKLAGTMNKPKNQTTLLSFCDDDVQAFMRRWPLRNIPGMGSKISHLIQEYVRTNSAQRAKHDEGVSSNKITTPEVLDYPGMSAEMLEKIVGGSGTERGIGEKIWNILRGNDDAEVKKARDIPSQISIEDTYMSRTINSQSELMQELHSLSFSLVRRLRTELVADDTLADAPVAPKWLAYPKTLRLSTRVKPKAGAAENQQARESFNRSSRSSPLPRFIFSLKDGAEHIAERLVKEAIVPLFRRLHCEKQGWNLALINIGMTNMVLTGGEEGGAGGGRDISTMFKTQGAKLKEFTTYNEPASAEDDTTAATHSTYTREPGREHVRWQTGPMAWDDDEEANSSPRCPQCGQPIPTFAMSAHQRFHDLGD